MGEKKDCYQIVLRARVYYVCGVGSPLAALVTNIICEWMMMLSTEWPNNVSVDSH